MTDELRVLHLTAWYPTKEAPYAVPFVKAHFDALRSFGRHRLVHVEVTQGGRPLKVSWKFGKAATSRVAIEGFNGPTRLLEWLSVLLLLLIRLRLGLRNWDVLMIHVAWPLFRFPQVVRLLFGKHIVIIEHWSAYSQNFNLPFGSRPHLRMQRMFDGKTPVISVSRQLGRDIANFAQRNDLEIHIVPNVVGADFFFEGNKPPPSIFMAASWNDFRKPFFVLHAMPTLLRQQPGLRLIIAGEGSQYQAMREYVAAMPWSARVEFLGLVSRARIAQEMRRAAVFAHPTTYETFSVVTAEALCCGVPAIVSDAGALPEIVVQGQSGLLVTNDEAAWRNALAIALDPQTAWDRENIARAATTRFSPHAVGSQLSGILQDVAGR